MKRFLNAILLFCLILCFIIISPQNAFSSIIGDPRSIEPSIYKKDGTLAEPLPETSFHLSCVAVTTGKKLPCSHEVTILPPPNENCEGGDGIRCGHNDAKHTVTRSTILNNNNNDKFRILGGLSDALNPQATHLTAILTEDYYFKLFSGEISGMLSVEKVSTPPPGWMFLPPCESIYSCTTLYPVFIQHCGGKRFCWIFNELRKPDTLKDGYIRCGKQSTCMAKDLPDDLDDVNWLEYDDPYNWPAHPTTDWGDWQFLYELKKMAKLWYEKFGRPLVINDISLPYGGLLDVNINWKRPHGSHRKGISADILSLGVPADIKPTKGPTDEQWVSVWNDYKLLDDVNLEYEDCAYKVNGRCVHDYNHLDLTQ